MIAAEKSIVGYIQSKGPASNPFGVIFDGDRKAYVGSPHGRPIPLTADVKRRVMALASKVGVWFEGDGGDIEPNKPLFGREEDYKGSWDDQLASSIKGYPPEFLSGLFSNVDENGAKQRFLNPNASIFDSILERQAGFRYFKDRRFEANDLRAFLRAGSEPGKDFLVMAQKPATKANLSAFFDAGERLMWPRNWQSYPNKFGKLAKKFEDARNKHLLAQPAGVFVVGAGHLLELLKHDRTLKMVGGSRVGE